MRTVSVPRLPNEGICWARGTVLPALSLVSGPGFSRDERRNPLLGFSPCRRGRPHLPAVSTWNFRVGKTRAVGAAELSPALQRWVRLESAPSPVGTALCESPRQGTTSSRAKMPPYYFPSPDR